MLVGKRHARLMGYCSSGIREHCERYQLDFRQFILQGLPEDELLATGNHYIVSMVEKARQEAQQEDKDGRR